MQRAGRRWRSCSRRSGPPFKNPFPASGRSAAAKPRERVSGGGRYAELSIAALKSHPPLLFRCRGADVPPLLSIGRSRNPAAGSANRAAAYRVDQVIRPLPVRRWVPSLPISRCACCWQRNLSWLRRCEGWCSACSRAIRWRCPAQGRIWPRRRCDADPALRIGRQAHQQASCALCWAARALSWASTGLLYRRGGSAAGHCTRGPRSARASVTACIFLSQI